MIYPSSLLFLFLRLRAVPPPALLLGNPPVLGDVDRELAVLELHNLGVLARRPLLDSLDHVHEALGGGALQKGENKSNTPPPAKKKPRKK